MFEYPVCCSMPISRWFKSHDLPTQSERLDFKTFKLQAPSKFWQSKWYYYYCETVGCVALCSLIEQLACTILYIHCRLKHPPTKFSNLVQKKNSLREVKWSSTEWKKGQRLSRVVIAHYALPLVCFWTNPLLIVGEAPSSSQTNTKLTSCKWKTSSATSCTAL